jgi:peptide methionine sulfoxide reductase msrA/msrB
VGIQYRSGIYFTGEEDKAAIEAIPAKAQSSFQKPLAVEARRLEHFFLQKSGISAI